MSPTRPLFSLLAPLWLTLLGACLGTDYESDPSYCEDCPAGDGDGDGDGGSGGCSECGDALCLDGACSACDPQDHTGCAPSEYCQAGESAAQHACVAGCRDDGDCSGEMRCNPTTHACVQCYDGPAHCVDSAPFCVDSQCVQCRTSEHDDDCPSPAASQCVDGACVGCGGDDAACTHLGAAFSVCDDDTCVECTGTSHTCPGDTAVPEYACDSLATTCTDRPVRSVDTCKPCVSDAECLVGLRCVQQVYDDGGMTVEVGYFCLEVADTPAKCTRPYVMLEDAVSIDGTTGAICGLAATNCTALQRSNAGEVECAMDGTPDDLACGPQAACVPAALPSYRCAIACGDDADCRPGGTCGEAAPNPGFCSN